MEKYKNKLIEFMKLSLEYNERINITALRTEELFWEKQIIDSLKLADYIDLNNKNILDIGTGGGIPGIVLAIAYENSSFTLLDSNTKKTNFCKWVVEKLNLKNVTIHTERIENLKEEFTEKFDITVSKAVAKLNILLEISAFTIKKDGSLLLFKGPNYTNELPLDSAPYIDLGLENPEIFFYKLEGDVSRVILKYIKTNETNNDYPRAYKDIILKPIF